MSFCSLFRPHNGNGGIILIHTKADMQWLPWIQIFILTNADALTGFMVRLTQIFHARTHAGNIHNDIGKCPRDGGRCFFIRSQTRVHANLFCHFAADGDQREPAGT